MPGLLPEVAIAIWIGVVFTISDQCRNNSAGDLELDGLRGALFCNIRRDSA